MVIAQLSPNSVAASTVQVNPQVKTDQATAITQVNADAKKAYQSVKTDTVTISQAALQKLASDGDNRAQETKEKQREQKTETFRGVA